MCTIVHNTLEQCDKLADLTRPPELDELTSLYKRLWEEKITDNIRVVNENETEIEAIQILLDKPSNWCTKALVELNNKG